MAQKINIPNVQITYRNLAGRPTEWNKKGGKRDFAIILDNQADIDALLELGFVVKQFAKKNEADPDRFFIKVKVNYRYNDEGELIAPHIYMINGKSKILLTPTTVGEVDRADIAYCDIVINRYVTEVNGQTFITPYLDKMYVNIVEDEFEKKYAMFDDGEDEIEAEEIPFE